MIAFQQPCRGFTASDLINLQAIWPEGAHRSDADRDQFLVYQPCEEAPWLSITSTARRHLSLASTNRVGSMLGDGHWLRWGSTGVATITHAALIDPPNNPLIRLARRSEDLGKDIEHDFAG